MSGDRKALVTAAIGAVLVMVAGFGLYRQGLSDGATSERLRELKRERIEAAEKTKKDSIAAVRAHLRDSIAEHKSDSMAKVRRAARAHVVLHGDTAVTPEGTQVLLPSIANLIRVDDVKIPQDSSTIMAKNFTIAAKDTVFVDRTRELTIADSVIVEKDNQKRPRFGFKSGVAAGVAGTLTVIKILASIL